MVYYCVIENPDMDLDESVVKLLPENLASEILQYKKQDDIVRLTVGKYLLRQLVTDLHYKQSILHEYRLDDNGKPQISGFLPFNITHSGQVVACAVLKESGLIGIDTEKIREIEVTKFNKQFPPQEMASILSDPNPQETFFRFWTMKEAVMKADGRGMRIPLHSIRLKGEFATIDDRNEQWNLYEIFIHDSVKSHVCSDLELKNIQVSGFTPQRLFS